jgi:hypothetical protein
MKQYLLPKPHRFSKLLWASKCKKPFCNVDEVTIVDRDRNERKVIPLHSFELASLPDVNQVFIGPLSKMPPKSCNQAVDTKPDPALQHDRDTTFVSGACCAKNNGGEPVLN